MTAPTVADLERATLNLAAHDSIVNGPEGTVVTTPGGRNVFTVAEAIATLKAFVYRGAWATTTAYALKDVVLQSGALYVCAVAHTSGTFATDLAALKWVLYQGLITAIDVASIAALRAAPVPAAVISINVLGYYTAGDGGGGTFYWDASSSAADDNGRTILPTGHVGNGRWRRMVFERMSTLAWGCKGDGVTDDTVALANAIQKMAQLELEVSGTLKITSTISLDPALGASGTIKLVGVGRQSKIVGNFSGYLFASTGSFGTTIKSFLEFRSMTLENLHATGGLVYCFQLVVPGNFEDLVLVAAYRGLFLDECFSLNVRNCYFEGRSFSAPGVSIAGAIGLLGNPASIIGCDFVGWTEGKRLWGNQGMIISGGRNEVNGTAFRLGLDENGVIEPLNSAVISGIEMEGNLIGMEIISIGAVVISGCTVQGSNSNAGPSQYGFFIYKNATNGCIMECCGAGGEFTQAAISNAGTPTMIACGAANSLSGRPAWANHANSAMVTLASGLSADATNTASSLVGNTQHVSIAGLDFRQNKQVGKNVGDKNVPITLAATTQAVTFNTGYTSANAAINTATVSAGGTLAVGSYFYNATLLNKLGETTATVEKTATTTGGNQTVTIAFATAVGGPNFRRRVYRGTMTGVYDGYFDCPLDSNANFVDNGQAFTGVGRLNDVNSSAITMAEPDANYAVNFKFNFDAGSAWWTAKTTAGFTLNWTNGAPANALVDWTLTR